MRDLARAPAGPDDPTPIAPAPRFVPGAVRLRLLLGGPVSQLGWAFLGLGLAIAWIFVGNSELRTFVTFAGQTYHVQGQVIGTEATYSSEDDEIIHAVRYAYSVDRVSYEGVSYTTAPSLDPGELVPIEFLASNPAISRIEGLRHRMFSAGVGFVLLFPLVGLVIAVYGARRGLGRIRLLAQGRAAMGALVGKQKTNVRVNKRPVYELSFQFRDHTGRERLGTIRTVHTAPVEDDAHEPLLYDPRRPQRIVLLDDLGRDVGRDLHGRLVAQRSSIPVLILPLLVGMALLAAMTLH